MTAIQQLINLIRNETSKHGNTRGRVADALQGIYDLVKNNSSNHKANVNATNVTGDDLKKWKDKVNEPSAFGEGF